MALRPVIAYVALVPYVATSLYRSACAMVLGFYVAAAYPYTAAGTKSLSL